MRLATCARHVLLLAALGVLLVGRPAQAQVGTLSIEGSCPGEITARITGGYPNHLYYLVFGFREAPFWLGVNSPCPGTLIGIRVAWVVSGFRLDRDGNGSLVGVAPPVACGHYFQAINVTICEPTNVVRIEF